jgi:urease accessory protein
MVADLAGLASFLAGRLGTSVVLEAHTGALACHLARAGQLDDVVLELEDALDARTASPTARAIRRRQGEQYRRAATALLDRRLFAVLDPCRPPGPPLPIVIGVAAAAAGLWPSDAATIVAYSSLTASATAALRLLGLDPFAVSATLAELAPDLDRIAAEAAGGVGGGIARLPAPTTPMLDYLFEEHSRRKDRLFAS